MKKTMKAVILALVGYVLSPTLAMAQQMPPIPVDKEVKIGKLDIRTQGNLTRLEDTLLILQTVFPMKPEKKEDVLRIIRNEFEQISQSVDPAELKTVKEFMVKSFTDHSFSCFLLNKIWCRYTRQVVMK